MYLQIKPHYGSEGPRQGSCGVFWGMFHTIETTSMEYLIEELARNLIIQKKYLESNISKKLHFQMRKTSAQS